MHGLASRSARRIALLGLATLVWMPLACGESSPSGGDTDGPPGGSLPGPTADGGSPFEARDAGPPPVPPLSFVLDEAAGKLRVRVPSATAADAVVYARVRRAGPGPSDVDCDALRRGAAPISLKNARALERELDAVGPAVAPTFLASAYGARSSRASQSRSLVDGCLVDAKGGVLARVSMSLMKAWDLFAPTVTVDATTRLHGVQAYAQACEADLGELSMFKNGELDCLGDPAMQIVPITVSDPANPDRVVAALDATTTAWPLQGNQRAAATRCDRPAWLDYTGEGVSQCSPFSRVGAFVNSKGTRIVVACRRYEVRSRDDASFDDINVIAHNPTSGRTCFFNSRLELPQNGRKIPSPASADADSFWMDVRDVATVRCTDCHDADPWVHSPWVDQLRGAGGRALVPKSGEDSAYTIATKYAVFARESFTVPTRNGDEAWKQPQHLVSAGKCGTCHRIGSKAGLSEWTARSVGHAESADWFNTWVSAAYRTPAKLRWMSPNALPDAQDDARAVSAILACGRGAAGCTLADTPH